MVFCFFKGNVIKRSSSCKFVNVITTRTRNPGGRWMQIVERVIEKMITMITALADKKFTGYIKINFKRGSLGKVEKFEEILKKK